MELEKQVCSLELAKRFKELGVKQESYFCWSWLKDTEIREAHGNKTLLMPIDEMESGRIYRNAADRVSAFTVAELGEMLPRYSHSWHPEDEQWFADLKTLNSHPSFCADTEADARAKMLIYILENKLIEEQDVQSHS